MFQEFLNHADIIVRLKGCEEKQRGKQQIPTISMIPSTREAISGENSLLDKIQLAAFLPFYSQVHKKTRTKCACGEISVQYQAIMPDEFFRIVRLGTSGNGKSFMRIHPYPIRVTFASICGKKSLLAPPAMSLRACRKPNFLLTIKAFISYMKTAAV